MQESEVSIEDEKIVIEEELKGTQSDDITYAKVYYQYNDYSFLSEESAYNNFPDDVCPPGEHVWRSTWAFGKGKCKTCKLISVKR